MLDNLMMLTQHTETAIQFIQVTESQFTLFPTKEWLVMLLVVTEKNAKIYLFKKFIIFSTFLDLY